MKKIAVLFLISFVFYMIGHLLWSLSIVLSEPFFFNEKYEIWLINFPFSLFAIFGILASYKLYINSKF